MKQWFITGCLVFGLSMTATPEGNAAQKISRGQFEVGQYVVDISAHQRNEEIQLRGRISYGPHCDDLQMKFKLESDAGKKTTVTTTVDDVGGSGSRTIRTAKPLSGTRASDSARWEIVDIIVKCKD